jgi:hypothetical protein
VIRYLDNAGKKGLMCERTSYLGRARVRLRIIVTCFAGQEGLISEGTSYFDNAGKKGLMCERTSYLGRARVRLRIIVTC